MLAVSEYLSSKAQDTQAQKEEAILYLIARIGVLNGFYSTGKYQNEHVPLLITKRCLFAAG